MRTSVTVPKGRTLFTVHIAALLTQVTNARFNPRAGFGRYYLSSGNELVTRVKPAVCPGKRDARASRLFCITWNVGRARKLFRITGNPGRARELFRIAGNLGRVCSSRASVAIAAHHSHTILTQRSRVD